LTAISTNDLDFAKKIIDSGAASEAGLVKARSAASKTSDEKKRKERLALFEGLDLPEPEAVPKATAEQLQRYVGKYKGPTFTIEVEVKDDRVATGFQRSTQI
jgi:hypothetical protein